MEQQEDDNGLLGWMTYRKDGSTPPKTSPLQSTPKDHPVQNGIADACTATKDENENLFGWMTFKTAHGAGAPQVESTKRNPQQSHSTTQNVRTDNNMQANNNEDDVDDDGVLGWMTYKGKDVKR